MDPENARASVEMLAAYKQLFQPESNPFTPWIPVVSALIGGLTGIGGGFLLEWTRSRREKKATTEIIKSEIASIVVYLNHRNFLDIFRKCQEELNRCNTENEKTIPNYDHEKDQATHKLYFVIPEYYDKLYNAHLEKLSLLDPKLSRKVVTFYAMFNVFKIKVSEKGSLSMVGTANSYERALYDLERLHSLGQNILGYPEDFNEALGISTTISPRKS